MAEKGPLHTDTLFEHVQDQTFLHLPRWFAPEHNGHIELPQPLATPVKQHGHHDDAHSGGHGHSDAGHHKKEYEVIWAPSTGIPVIDNSIKPLDLVFTKFMGIELLVAIIMVFLFGGLAAKLRPGGAPKGRIANAFEAILLFIRDEVARPTIGKKDADRFLPFLWTLFFFVLGCNLFGMLPWMGSPTGSLAVTAALALVTFIVVVAAGVKELGPLGFLKAQVPHMDLPKPLAVILIPMIFVIEVFGFFVKHFVLAIRLLANMFAGHIVLAVLIGFIGVATGAVWYGVAPLSVLGATMISCLELFVAFLQAYIFVFLSSLFIGAAVHPH